MINEDPVTNGNGARLRFLQYLNTVILTGIGTITVVIFTILNTVRIDQSEYSKELLRLKTVQDINVASVKAVDVKADLIDARVDKLELNYLDYIKSWVDANYIRKPQK
jgi:hypothetical protein